MASPLDYLQRSTDHPWLICPDSEPLDWLLQQRIDDLSRYPSPRRILLTDRHPVSFLAGYLAACATNQAVFLGNPDWGQAEWQQVMELARPQVIWGEGKGDGRDGRDGEDGGGGSSPFLASASSSSNTPAATIMIPTGGSSGQVRFAMHTWDTLAASVRGFRQHFQVDQVNVCCVLPLYHVSGLMQAMRSLLSGGNLIVQPFKQLEAGDLIPDQPSDYFLSLVPTQLQRLLQNSTQAAWLTRFRTILLGGAPAWPELLQQARQLGIRLSLTYGMTETASQVVALRPEEFLQGQSASGRVLPHARLTIQSETGVVLPVGTVGRISLAADSLAWGYYPVPFGDRTCYQPDDLGYLDHQGYLHIVGRSSDTIITGGEKVFPAEVEAAIRATGLVQDVVVLGLEDRLWGQMVTAVYVSPPTPGLTEGLQQALRGKLSPFKQPKHWIRVDHLPRNAQGKLNRSALKALAKQQLGI
jgi:O-succinylbenzoic acid--CoA ligase